MVADIFKARSVKETGEIIVSHGRRTHHHTIDRLRQSLYAASAVFLRFVLHFLMINDLNSELREHVSLLDMEQLRDEFAAHDEFIKIDNFLPSSLVDEILTTLPKLDPLVHRNYIPRHKKGGSISRYDLDRTAPRIAELYSAEVLTEFLQAICGRDLNFCPANDPHTYALYYYTEPGDHISYHYDTSYYQGARYTVLIGLVTAPSCVLEYQLHTRNPKREVETRRVELDQGMLVLFNGDKLYHRITPLAEDERRISLTFEYLTNTKMHPLLRFVSNMKDSISYFGFKQVFRRARDGSVD